MDQIRHAAKSNIGKVNSATTFQGFIRSPVSNQLHMGCRDAHRLEKKAASRHARPAWNIYRLPARRFEIRGALTTVDPAGQSKPNILVFNRE
jgi:hypothetical protein